MAYTPRHHQVATEDGTKYIARSADGTIIHQGEVQKGQNITTGQEVMDHTADPDKHIDNAATVADKLPKLPPPPQGTDQGEWIEPGLYRYGNKIALVVQAHWRTQHKPEDTPALFRVRKPDVPDADLCAETEAWDGGKWLDYVVGYKVKHDSAIWEAINTTHTWIEPAHDGNGAISWKHIKDCP